jgi:predicted DNA-binding transcriptional regulator YafY
VAQTDRHYKIRQWLATGRCVPRSQLLEDLEVSPATLKRDIALLRDRLNMPIAWDPERRGWRLDRTQATPATQYELPGLWFSAEEIHALLTMQHLLANLDAGGLLGPHIEPLMKRLSQLLGTGAPPQADIARRIRVQTVGSRRILLPNFQAVGGALLRRKRVAITYRSRSRDERTEREVSPQRMVHYRDNWYLDAWCHTRLALRSFSVDAIEQVQALERAAIDVPESQLDQVLGAGYGIFAGQQVGWARLRFTPERARWVAAERWHPQQRGQFDAEGRWQLDLPYADPRELVMDILRHVPEVEVMWPEELAEQVRERLVAGIRRLDE